VEGAPETIFVSTGLVFSYVNPAGCRLFGAASPEELLNKPLMDRIDPSVHGLVGERIHRVFDNKEAAPTVEQLWLKLDGSPFPVEVSSVPITYLGKESALTFARDITERKRAEEAQRSSRQFVIAAAEANAANKAKSLFLSTMSHEIRTPMNAILGYSQLMLRDNSLGNEAMENLKVIKRSGEHLLNIINNILDMSKIESGHLDVTPKTFNLPAHVHDLEAMFRLPAEAKEVQFEVFLTGDDPVGYITADEGKIRQVLINLLGNAVKFTERGRIALRVSLNIRNAQVGKDQGKDRLWLSAVVEDTGIGMSSAELTTLFQPFVQGEGGRHVQRGGTGLGLAISREVARAMGGDITVASRLGGGSTFRFEVPVERAAAGEFPRLPGSRGRVLGIRAEQDAPRILIADDMPDNREWLTRLLSALGFSVRSVENGESAVRVWTEWNPRLILMDVHMPGMNGLEATRRIRSSPSGDGTAIIALTADATEEQHTKAFAHGVDSFISKPCAEDELLETILRHLPGIAYTYQNETPGGDNGNAVAATPGDSDAEKPLEVPADLVLQMQEAIADGDKALLDRLIRATEERGNVRSARVLRQLANLYKYERIAEVLEKTCRS
jgi:PAS domain S-box-containing protein